MGDLEPSWERLGSALERLRGVLGASWRHLGRLGSVLEACWRCLGGALEAKIARWPEKAILKPQSTRCTSVS